MIECGYEMLAAAPLGVVVGSILGFLLAMRFFYHPDLEGRLQLTQVRRLELLMFCRVQMNKAVRHIFIHISPCSFAERIAAGAAAAADEF